MARQQCTTLHRGTALTMRGQKLGQSHDADAKNLTRAPMGAGKFNVLFFLEILKDLINDQPTSHHTNERTRRVMGKFPKNNWYLYHLLLNRTVVWSFDLIRNYILTA